ncbi:PTS mannitol transporter subunit IICBA [Liquorilactobacillus satsumensis]|uniref:PTS system mannitol-specific EIICB component n=1 Tax=Liquorilactobacillus satsumensis DSM 16230 = JCM 12392 TaxID=1423801 RepID=A0A0R1V3Z9_9LACO|nr:PTS mannitol transporter subunit IICBA [Liquorilactobacillus satsumensis]KRM00312.1 PTS system, mannitol-specific IIBC component [Liquorilactobacillus satsumensis DSM 16230 = JCM 12392]MCC7667709.1 PTS mannitol transporter subunit IICBA [Liquorilactobacillus satsumensis]MCP9313026.1 PTS mannitol transporter subunit IICBA [Liquorilactobacillus satsumensis]MCP9328972.1 PTS mannitol transporter subunit IICBA [Liquorilactobacillus satsumensis]MCP9357681.1 PTS mannitol transporter subunit IICBA 
MEAKVSKKKTLKTQIQKLGTSLSGMIMPNIAAIIAWGLVTAIFMAAGWFPNKQIATLITPMLNYMIPLLIAYVGGRMVYEERGAVVGAIAVMGVIVGAKVPMFLGAMIMGPLGGWCIKKFDQMFQDKIKSGFEMIYNNFSSGILGMILAIFGVFVINPLVTAGSTIMSKGVDWIISVHMLPLANILIEPAKVLFLNNAIGNGILVPLGIQQAAQSGKSVLFLLESNPGPGLGILLAFMLFGKGAAKASAPGAALIEFFGGIHEIYFPYVLMKPALIFAAIAGGVSGTFTFSLLDTGVKAAASPGSIIAILLMTPKGNYLKILAGVLVAAIVSFIVAALILKADKSDGKAEDELAEKQAQMSQMKAESKGAAPVAGQSAEKAVQEYADVKRIIFACDAGMGSSAMGASLLRDKVKKAGITDIPVTNTAISRLKDEDGLLVITQEELADRALQKTPNAMHIAVDNFLSSPKYDQVVLNLKALTQLNPEKQIQKKNEEKPTKNQRLAEIDYAAVTEVDFIHHDQREGSATMAASLFKDRLKKVGKQVPVKNLGINELEDSKQHLVIVTPEAEKNLKLRYTEVQVVTVKNLLEADEYSYIVERLA